MNIPAFFLSLMAFVFEWEGLTFTGGENDKGGATKYGVSLRFLQGLPLADGDLNHDGRITWKDVYSMTKDQALDIFWKYFGTPLFVGAWPTPLAAALLDTGVNCGRGMAVKWAQDAFNAGLPTFCPGGTPLLVDGGFGPKTRAALCTACRVPGFPGGDRQLAAGIISRRKAHYARLNASGDPDYTTNYQGWMHRVASLEAFIAGRPWRMSDKPWEHSQAA